MQYQILISVVGVLLVTGLACVGFSRKYGQIGYGPPVVERRKTEPEEENEELTRLGRPIREMKF